jgi:hypothetical protein
MARMRSTLTTSTALSFTTWPCGGCPPCRPARSGAARSSTASIASRVVPGSSDTTTRSSPSRRFTSELLPTFGRLITATRIDSSSVTSGSPLGSGQGVGDRRLELAEAAPVQGADHQQRSMPSR